MSEPRTPAREHYDAVVDLATSPEEHYALVLVKFTYRLTPRGAVLDAPEPLLHDLRDPEQEPRLVPGTDFWPRKLFTDVVVEGSAFTPGGRPAQQMVVTAAVGNRTKRVQVTGRRVVEWSERGTPRFSQPEPFTEVPLVWENSYGGLDWRAEDPEVLTRDPLELAAMLQIDHPGLYPRNPFGRGYLVSPEPVDGVELPLVEDPEDLLTPERLITRDPHLWYRQPVPGGLGWMHPMMFPRYVHAPEGPDAWFPGPEDAGMPEVRRGFVIPNYRTIGGQRRLEDGPAPMFFQGASHGMVFSDLAAGLPVRITGMHPLGARTEFTVPGPPSIEMAVDGRYEHVQPRLHSLVVRPGSDQFYVLFGATMPITRPMMPGIHKHIPIAAAINGDAPIVYDAPVPMMERLATAMGTGEAPKEE